MLFVNRDTVGQAVIVECEGIKVGDRDAVRLRDAVTAQATIRAIVIDLSRVSVIASKGLSMLLQLQHWTRQRGIQLKLFNPCPSVKRDLEQAGSLYGFNFAPLAEVMSILIDARERQPMAA